MKQNKSYYSMDEMAELFVSVKPYLKPTKQAVGRFAKQQGFVLMHQMERGKITYFYVRKEDL